MIPSTASRCTLTKAAELARRALRETQAATALAAETARRGKELEQAIAANFSITLSSK